MQRVFQIGDLTPWKYFLGVSIALGIIFAALGPEGTTDRGIILSIIQWLAQVMIPMALCIIAHQALHRSAFFDRMNPWLKLLASGCAGAVLFSPIAYGIDLLLGEWPAAGHSHLAEWLDELGSVIAPVAITWIAINIPFQIGYSFRREAATEPSSPNISPAPPPDPAPSAPPFFLSLIPAARRG